MDTEYLNDVDFSGCQYFENGNNRQGMFVGGSAAIATMIHYGVASHVRIEHPNYRNPDSGASVNMHSRDDLTASDVRLLAAVLLEAADLIPKINAAFDSDD